MKSEKNRHFDTGFDKNREIVTNATQICRILRILQLDFKNRILYNVFGKNLKTICRRVLADVYEKVIQDCTR